MNKHTPGPWRMSHDHDDAWFLEYSDGTIGEVLLWDGDTARANAHLIAAAPELLEALLCFISDTRFQVGVGGNPNVVKAMVAHARAAIAKATGNNP